MGMANQRKNLLFLRGAIPPKHEHPEKLLYGPIEECEDMWTQWFHTALHLIPAAQGVLMYQGAKREYKVDDVFTERWVSSFQKHPPKQAPDVIIGRGGFPYYDHIMKKFPDAIRIYYGAGRRYYPAHMFKGYDAFLCDSPRQHNKVHTKYAPGRARMFIKPAARLFQPAVVQKEYDVCFMANAAQQGYKRHKLLIDSLAGSGLRVLNVGNTDKGLIKRAKDKGLDITWAGWHLRKHLPALISKCRVGVCCSTSADSCPRVIPEYLACGLPIVVTDNVNFWQDLYVTPETGMLASEDGIRACVEAVLAREHQYDVRAYYDKHLGMDTAAKWLVDIINDLDKGR
jgi:glycosyltransferase involved in cell wall biosynthesis